MSVTVRIDVKSNRVKQMANLMNGAIVKSNLATAKTIRDRMVMDAPRDTSALAEGLYVTSAIESDYQERAGASTELRPNVAPDDEIHVSGMSAGIGSVMPYIEHVVNGTARTHANPFIYSAVEGMERTYTEIAIPIVNAELEE